MSNNIDDTPWAHPDFDAKLHTACERALSRAFNAVCSYDPGLNHIMVRVDKCIRRGADPYVLRGTIEARISLNTIVDAARAMLVNDPPMSRDYNLDIAVVAEVQACKAVTKMLKDDEFIAEVINTPFQPSPF
jgi:hypothetical protein